MQDRLQGRYGPELKVFVPIDHKMAVACGAIVFHRNPRSSGHARLRLHMEQLFKVNLKQIFTTQLIRWSKRMETRIAQICFSRL